MNIFRNIDEVNKVEDTVLTIGTFDGFHKGHQQIISSLVSESEAGKGRSFLITFEPHPRSVLSSSFDLKLITTVEEKLNLIEKSGVENVLILEFTRELAALSSDEFIGKKIVEKIGLSELIIGYDHRLGHDRDGNEQKLRELGLQYGFEVKPVYAVKIGDAAISSTKIRHAITDGEIRKANSYLGWNYSFSGIVVKGAMRGRTLGFPTINVSAENPRKLMPGRGVYVVRILLDGQSWFGIMNIGMRPTFGDAIELITEVYIFNFNRDVYGSRVTVEVLDRLRGEIKFQSADALIAQLETDKKEALNIINNLNN